MNGMNLKKRIYLFLFLIGGVFFLAPNNVLAKDTLMECNYYSEVAGTSYTLTIYDDYSAKGNFITYDGRKINDKQNNKFDNWNSLKETAKSKQGSEMCPKYAMLQKKATLGPICSVFNKLCNYTAKGYFDYEPAAEDCSKAKGSTQCLNLYKMTDSNGNASLANKNNNSNNKVDDKVNDDSLIGNENLSKCTDFLGNPKDSKSVAWLLQKLFNYVKVLGPILVILFSTLDFTKTILSSDEESMKKSQKRLGIRLMCAVGIYFLPMIVTLIINIVFGTADANAICGIR